LRPRAVLARELRWFSRKLSCVGCLPRAAHNNGNARAPDNAPRRKSGSQASTFPHRGDKASRTFATVLPLFRLLDGRRQRLLAPVVRRLFLLPGERETRAGSSADHAQCCVATPRGENSEHLLRVIPNRSHPDLASVTSVTQCCLRENAPTHLGDPIYLGSVRSAAPF
jgi:hypothetical protein